MGRKGGEKRRERTAVVRSGALTSPWKARRRRENGYLLVGGWTVEVAGGWVAGWVRRLTRYFGTCRTATFNALVVLCSTQNQVDKVMTEALTDASYRPVGVDVVIAQLVSTSHESYTMTVLPAGDDSPLPPVELQCDGVAKKIVWQDNGSLVLESAQRLRSISVSLHATHNRVI